MYNFPTGVTGTGQCVGIIELGGGFLASDNNAAFAAMGLATPQITAVSVDGGQNAPGDSADAEVACDSDTERTPHITPNISVPRIWMAQPSFSCP